MALNEKSTVTQLHSVWYMYFQYVLVLEISKNTFLSTSSDGWSHTHNSSSHPNLRDNSNRLNIKECILVLHTFPPPPPQNKGEVRAEIIIIKITTCIQVKILFLHKKVHFIRVLFLVMHSSNRFFCVNKVHVSSIWCMAVLFQLFSRKECLSLSTIHL